MINCYQRQTNSLQVHVGGITSPLKAPWAPPIGTVSYIKVPSLTTESKCPQMNLSKGPGRLGVFRLRSPLRSRRGDGGSQG